DAIAEWAGFFAGRFAADEGKPIRGLSAQTLALLSRYGWPGNLRQLQHAVRRAVALADGPFLAPGDFPQVAAHVGVFPNDTPSASVHTQEPAVREGALSLIRDGGDMLTLAELEERAIRFALVHYQG